MSRINPFRPNAPIAPGMFAGRLAQVDALEEALLQTRAGNPKNFMVTGERGIGKTSLLQYFKWVAQGHIPTGSGDTVNFLVVELDLDSSSTDVGLIRRVELGFNRELAKTERARSFLSQGWEFLKRIEAFGMSLREGEQITDPEVLHDEFAHSLALTTSRICEADAETMFKAKYDGVILLIDEADNAPKSMRLGAFLKLLTERVQREGCNRLMVGLAGMPSLREVLREGHPSSLRLFDELPLDTLSREDVSTVIDRALDKANKENSEQTSIDDAARNALITLAEGYPHFIQQFGYSGFAADTDFVIDIEDVRKGTFGPMGAMDKIGDRYYRDDFYNKIQKDSYRQVLHIMADSENRWVKKVDIRSRFKGKTTTLDNAIHALVERKIILPKEGERGTYRLQHRGFAYWIKMYTSTPAEIQTQIEANQPGET
ncbi:AAA family ATPase [Nitrospira sp. NS4]|uniref:AAA family ATPase n=1 Tax=Nitrospira sp. NS4 TaxID=3414498 RepID=UPI003C2C4722